MRDIPVTAVGYRLLLCYRNALLAFFACLQSPQARRAGKALPYIGYVHARRLAHALRVAGLLEADDV